MQIFVNANYDFVKYRFHAVVFSLIWVLIGAGLFLKNGINWGIDFAGGANVVLKFRDQVPLNRLRADLADATIQSYGKAEDRAVLIRLPRQKGEVDLAGQVVAKLNRDLNPEAATGKLDLNFQGRDRLTDLLASVDPDNFMTVLSGLDPAVDGEGEGDLVLAPGLLDGLAPDLDAAARDVHPVQGREVPGALGLHLGGEAPRVGRDDVGSRRHRRHRSRHQ